MIIKSYSSELINVSLHSDVLQDCYSPKMVANKLNLNYNTVKNYIIQLSKDGYLLRLQKGLYRWGGRLAQNQIEKIMAEHIPLFHAIQYVITGGRECE